MTAVHKVLNTTTECRDDSLMVIACCTALGTLIPIALYQTGLISHLPDPPLAIFDSERITRSKAAHPWGLPDSLLGLASFGTTLVLILAARRNAPAKKLLGAKLAIDAGTAALNATRQLVLFRKLCFWCTATVLATGIMAFTGRNVIKKSLLEIHSD